MSRLVESIAASVFVELEGSEGRSECEFCTTVERRDKKTDCTDYGQLIILRNEKIYFLIELGAVVAGQLHGARLINLTAS